MKVYPVGELIGVPNLDDDDDDGLRYGRAGLAGVAAVEKRLASWTPWTVRAQNSRASYRGRPMFHWNVGSSTCPRFETACLLWMYARSLFRLGRYFEAREAFTRCASEVLMTLDRLGPITLVACGKARLRCLIRSQRDCIAGLRGEPESVASRALWLIHAEDTYARLPTPRKEIAAGEGIFFAAEALIARREGRHAE